MERKEEYRHYVDSKTKQIFLDSLKRAVCKLNKNKFGFIGVIGSGNKKDSPSHDIDVLIFPSKESKIGETILEIAKLYEEVEKELKKHHERFYLAVSPKKSIQEVVYYLSSLEEGGAGLIPIHSLFFTNYHDFKKFNPVGFIKKIKGEIISVYGNWSIIKELPRIPQKKLDPYYFVLDFEMTSRIKNFPRHLIRSSAESLFEYLKSKYNIPTKGVSGEINKIDKEFKEILKKLDKQTYN